MTFLNPKMERVRTRNAYSLSIEELAGRQRRANSLGTESGAVKYARKVDQEGKARARNSILKMFSRRKFPKGLSILTMPGLGWEFEYRLLALREGGNWRRKIVPASTTHICSVELDPTVYAASVLSMPRTPDSSIVNYVRSPMWCTHSTGTDVIRRFLCCDVYSLMANNEPMFDAAWLDFLGPLTVDRMERVRGFWETKVRKSLIVTFLKARHDGEIRLGTEFDGMKSWLEEELAGTVEHYVEYQDGRSPMAQFAVSKRTP